MQTIQFIAVPKGQPTGNRSMDSIPGKDVGEKSDLLFEEVLNESTETPESTVPEGKSHVSEENLDDLSENQPDEFFNDSTSHDRSAMPFSAVEIPRQRHHGRAEQTQKNALAGVDPRASDQLPPLSSSITQGGASALPDRATGTHTNVDITPLAGPPKGISQTVPSDPSSVASKLSAAPSQSEVFITQGIRNTPTGTESAFISTDLGPIAKNAHLGAISAPDTVISGRSFLAAEAYPPLSAQLSAANGNSASVSFSAKVPEGIEKIPFDQSLAGGANLAGLTQDIDLQERILAQTLETTSQPSTSRLADAPAVRSDATRLIAAQMATALSDAQNKSVQIALSPEELGRVRMVLSTTDTGVNVSIVAERPETLDLMRRNIEQLVGEFRELGYEDIKFVFSGTNSETGHDQSGSAKPPDPGNKTEVKHETVDTSSSKPIHAVSDRALDLRL